MEYRAVDFETLLDSPAYAARHLSRHLVHSRADKPVWIDVLAETEAGTQIPAPQLAAYGRAFEQVEKLFGSHPYDHYDVIAELSGRLTGQGVEHRQSSEDSLSPTYFSDPEGSYTQRNLLVHEYVHVWNGKLHRPAGLIVPDYNTPMQDDLLWIYEGLTTYLDKVLTVRGGLWTAEDARDLLAETYATYDHEPGRNWRSLQDTTVQPIVRDAPEWQDWARGADYYEEGSLLWLDVDTLIRQQSGGRRSLDDFIGRFFGGGDRDRGVRSYDFASVVAALNAVQPYDWARMLRERLDGLDAVYPKQGLARSGYRLVYTDAPSEWTKRRQARGKAVMLDYSLGATIGENGVVRSVVWDSPSFAAGLLAGDRIVSIDDKPFSVQNLLQTVAAGTHAQVNARLAVEGADGPRTLTVSLSGGLRYPQLQPIGGAPDVLGAILRPRD